MNKSQTENSDINTVINQGGILYKIAESNVEFNEARALFREYAASLEIDLCFQDFDTELETMEIQYNRPKGALIIAYIQGIAAGCVAIREFDSDTAELKRMYVRPDYRGVNIGRTLLEMAVEKSAELGYGNIRLDTLPSMAPALKLYRAFGFYEITPYRFNPVEGAIYMEKTLSVNK